MKVLQSNAKKAQLPVEVKSSQLAVPYFLFFFVEFALKQVRYNV